MTDGFFHSIGMIDQPEHTGIGWDSAGIVTQASTDVDVEVGTRVAGLVPGFDRDFGSYAEEIVADRDWIAVVPDGLEPARPTTLPLNALTADQIVDLLGPGDDGRLLVTGAAGAVGAFVVPLAIERGWRVTGLARATDEGSCASSARTPPPSRQAAGKRSPTPLCSSSKPQHWCATAVA